MKNLILILLTSVITFNAIACSCNEPGSVEEAYEYSDAVFHGKVISKKYVSYSESIKKEFADSIRYTLNENKINLFDSESIIKLEFEIQKCFKGTMTNDTIVIYTTRTSASCGYTRFEIGKEYIVYSSSNSYPFRVFFSYTNELTFEKENTFWTNHCTRTCEYNDSEIKELENI